MAEPKDRAMTDRPYVRQKRKPPKGTRCDCKSPDYSKHAPQLKGCPNEATVELKGGPLPFETWVCESCAERLVRHDD